MPDTEFSRGGAAVGADKDKNDADADLYALLNVSPGADASEIRTAYRRAALSTHPDKGGTSQAFHSLTDAFNILSCPNSRCLYDQRRSQEFKPSAGNTRGRKRACNSADWMGPPFSKARCSASARKQRALQNLHFLLQGVEKPLRGSLMSCIPLNVQQALIDFINGPSEKVAEPTEGGEQLSCGVACGSTRIATSGNKSKAQLDIEQLRIYTRWVSLAAAIEHQLVLAKVRDRILVASDADKSFWSTPHEPCKIFEAVFAEHDTSMDQLGLSVYVEMRAPEWVGSSHRITSPVTNLADAIVLRSRLLQARSMSWELLRTEWVALLQRGKKRRSVEEADAHVQQARIDFLEQRLKHAVQCVERALKSHDQEK